MKHFKPNTTGTRVYVKTGSEGPAHDPYHYEEITVTRPDGRAVTLHIGLGTWAEATGGRITGRTRDEAEAMAVFEYYVGVSYRALMRAYHSLPWRRLKAHPCGLQHIVDVNGYPGETLTVCGKCGHVVDAHQDMSDFN